jgi:hypothetical protein
LAGKTFPTLLLQAMLPYGLSGMWDSKGICGIVKGSFEAKFSDVPGSDTYHHYDHIFVFACEVQVYPWRRKFETFVLFKFSNNSF